MGREKKIRETSPPTSDRESLQSSESGSNGDQDPAEAPPSLEDIEGGPDGPVLLRPKALSHVQHPEGLIDGFLFANSGRPVEVESNVFSGKIYVWIKGLPSSPEGLFNGKHRQSSITVQGRFKWPLNLDDLVTGQEFSKPLTNIPSMFQGVLEVTLRKIAHLFSPSMTVSLRPGPSILVSVVAAAQQINVSEVGQQPDPSQPLPDNIEDMSLFDSSLTDTSNKPLESSKRMKFFHDPEARKCRSFSTEHIWTFVIYQSQVDISKYCLTIAPLGLKGLDLASRLPKQPLQFMMKDRHTQNYLFNFEAWHPKLLESCSPLKELG